MASQSSLNHKRTDSGVDGTDTISGTLATAQSFCTAVSSFTSEHGFQAINELVQLAPQRELEIKKRDEAIQDLNAKLVALRKEHDVYNRQQLSNFEGRYDEWKEENTTLQDEIEELETASKEKDSEVTTLQSQLERFKARVNDLEMEHTQMTKRMKERGQQLGELEARLQRAQADMNERVQEIEKAHSQIDALQRSLEDETGQHRVLKEEANKTRARLKDFLQFSVKITELDLPDM
jgi:chromosome segregation ATPase